MKKELVEIVRCKDCKFYLESGCPCIYETEDVYDDDGYYAYGGDMIFNLDENGFCSIGELRKE